MNKKTLAETLDALTMPGELYQVVDEATGVVRCTACAHRCLLSVGKRGICKVRFNAGGELRVPAGYVSGLHVDPIEKKPFFHVLPGTNALSFGMLGCNFHCPFCQNWLSAQALRDARAGCLPEAISPEAMLRIGRNVSSVASTYNEPLITSEWAVSIFKPAREAGLRTLYVSNGHATPEALDYLAPWLDAYKIDLKTMQTKAYRRLGGRLQPVLDTIKLAYERGLWVEVVTLVIPDFNDSREALKETASYIASVSPDIPWHVTAFHPTYKMTDRGRTPVSSIARAVEVGYEAGLHYVYAGNLPGNAHADTRCPSCGETLVRRTGFSTTATHLQGSACPACGAEIAGIWQ